MRRLFSFPFVVRWIISFTLVWSGLAHGLTYGRTAVAQELSPTILQTIPRVVERLNSPDIHERIRVLDELVTIKQETHLPSLVFPHNLPASDYSIVAQSILAGNLEQIDERSASTTWWKLTHVAKVFKLKELVKPLTSYLPKSGPVVQFAILQTLNLFQPVESVPEIATLLQSPRENIRREALDILINLRAREAIPTLLALMQDKDPDKRLFAMKGLVQVKGREAAPDVLKLLDDENETNRYWALDALVNLNAREHAQAVWKLTEANEPPQTQVYAVAALTYFGEPRAIPIAVKKATEKDLSRRLDMLSALVKLKANAVVPALVALLESPTVLGGNASDTGTDSNIRSDIITYLGQLGAREAIPVLRSYARGRDSNKFLQQAAVRALGLLGARESVNDLLMLLDKQATGEENATAEVGIALAQIGDRTTWRKLIDLAARPSCIYRSEIIIELNRHLDRELWERIQTQMVQGLYIKSVKDTVDTFSRESGIRIVLDYQPGTDPPGRAPLPGDEYPWANTSSAPEIALSYCLRMIIDGLSNDRMPRTFTFIFDDKQIRILSVERAIEWWRKQILSEM